MIYITLRSELLNFKLFTTQWRSQVLASLSRRNMSNVSLPVHSTLTSLTFCPLANQAIHRVNGAVSISYPTLLSSPLALQSSIGRSATSVSILRKTNTTMNSRGSLRVAPNVSWYHPHPRSSLVVQKIPGKAPQTRVQFCETRRANQRKIC